MAGPAGDGYGHTIGTSAAQRIGTPTDVADAAVFLLGPEGGFVTGADLLIDDGVIAAMRAQERTAHQQAWPTAAARGFLVSASRGRRRGVY